MKKNKKLNELESFINEFILQLRKIDQNKIQLITKSFLTLQKSKSRLFIVGMGGSAANASHATNDFRKITNINTICLTDNISELTARINDDNDFNYFKEILKIHNPSKKDCILILSVGGGSYSNKSSISLYKLAQYARNKKIKLISIIGRKKSLIGKISDICLSFDLDNNQYITPYSEVMQSFVWHYLVSQNILNKQKTKW